MRCEAASVSDRSLEGHEPSLRGESDSNVEVLRFLLEYCQLDS